MKTHMAKECDGHLIAFEIEAIYYSRNAIAEILKTVKGVSDVQFGGRFGSNNDVRLMFNFQNSSFIVWEPYGDNSRYWIGPMESSQKPVDIRTIELAFINYSPPLHKRIVGDLFNFRLPRRS
jgi:hypothetical protein